jgi:hypothetical protein
MVPNPSETVTIMVLLCEFHNEKGEPKRLDNQKIMISDELEPWPLFTNAMKAPMTRVRSQTRVVKFFEFLGIDEIKMEEMAVQNHCSLMP